MAHKKLTTILGRETKKCGKDVGSFSCNSFHNRASFFRGFFFSKKGTFFSVLPWKVRAHFFCYISVFLKVPSVLSLF